MPGKAADQLDGGLSCNLAKLDWSVLVKTAMNLFGLLVVLMLWLISVCHLILVPSS